MISGSDIPGDKPLQEGRGGGGGGDHSQQDLCMIPA